MDWQQFVSLAIVAATAGALLWGRLRRRKSGWERQTSCSACASGHEPPQYSVIFHARKGERPEVIVKMK